MLDSNRIILLLILVSSFTSLWIQLFWLIKTRKKGEEKAEKILFDAKYVQKFIQAVGSYLGETSNFNYSHYKAMSADIYRHIPSKHWMLAEKIDQAISAEDTKAAWDALKLFSQSLAEGGIEAIELDVDKNKNTLHEEKQ